MNKDLLKILICPKTKGPLIYDKKNEELGWFDLGNHIIILGIILFAIFIAINA